MSLRVSVIVTDDNGMTRHHQMHDLPEVFINPQQTRIADNAHADRPGYSTTSEAPFHLRKALAHLALWVDLVDDPPVTDAEVDFLAKEFLASGMSVVTLNGEIVQDYARRLLKRGSVTVNLPKEN